jgi:DNA-binding NarL/FixJ family response regulator
VQYLITPDATLVGDLAILKVGTQSIGVPYRMSECNSFYNGGASGVSDSYASSLWVIDFLFNCVQGGASGVNFHGGGDGPGYTPIADNGSNVVGVTIQLTKINLRHIRQRLSTTPANKIVSPDEYLTPSFTFKGSSMRAACSRVSTAITLAIADANLMTGRLLADQFKRHAGFAIVSCDNNRASFLKSVEQTKCAVALIGADLQDGPLSGLAALRDLHQADSDLRSILMYDRSTPELVVEGLRAGARGFFPRSTSEFADLRKCVRRVCEGQIWIGNAELEYVFAALTHARPLRVLNSDGLSLLSPREEDVMRLVAEGLGNREIAKLLALSEHTVKNYLFRIFDKLGISTRVELVLYAVSQNEAGSNAPVTTEKEKTLAKTAGQGA